MENYNKVIRTKRILLIVDFVVAAVSTAVLLFLGKECPTCVGVGFIVTIPLFVLALCGVVGFIYQCISLLYFVRKNKKQPTEKSATTPLQKSIINMAITPLLEAVLSGKLESTRAALAADPTQLNTPYAENGNTPLHVAVWNGYTDIVKLLLEQPGIDLHIKNKAGKTAFDLAQDKNLPEIINLLASVGNKQEEN